MMAGLHCSVYSLALTISCITGADAGGFAADAVATADLIARRHGAARREGHTVAGVRQGVGVPVAAVGDCAVAAEAVAAAEPVHAGAHARVVVARAPVGALHQFALAGVRELGVFDERVLPLGSHRDVVVAHVAVQAAAPNN